MTSSKPFYYSEDPESLLLTVDGFLSNSESDLMIAFGDFKANYEQAGVRQPDGTYKMVSDYRHNQRGSIDAGRITDLWFKHAKHLLPTDLRGKRLQRLHPVLRFYKYGKGDYFNKHKDASLKENDETSLITFMIYLTSVGKTLFEIDGKEIKVAGKKGTLVIFNHKITHSSPPLDEDLKIVVRSDVMYKYIDPN